MGCPHILFISYFNLGNNCAHSEAYTRDVIFHTVSTKSKVSDHICYDTPSHRAHYEPAIANTSTHSTTLQTSATDYNTVKSELHRIDTPHQILYTTLTARTHHHYDLYSTCQPRSLSLVHDRLKDHYITIIPSSHKAKGHSLCRFNHLEFSFPDLSYTAMKHKVPLKSCSPIFQYNLFNYPKIWWLFFHFKNSKFPEFTMGAIQMSKRFGRKAKI